MLLTRSGSTPSLHQRLLDTTASAARLARGSATRRALHPHSAVIVMSVALVTVVHGFVAMGAAGPMFQADEVGMLGNSRLFAGADPEWRLAGSSYMPGLSLLFAPAWWFTSSSIVVYQIALAVGVVLAVVAIWPLSLIARWAGASRSGSIVVGSVIMLAPARTVPSNYVLGETLLLIATATVFLAARRFRDHLTIRNGLLLGLAAGFAIISHGRGVAIAFAVGCWALWFLRRSLRPALAAAGTTLAVAAGSFVVLRWIERNLYYVGDRGAATFRNPWQGFAEIFQVTAGEAWYLMAAWPAVGIAGTLWVLHRAFRDRVATLIAGATVLTLALVIVQVSHDGYGSPFTRLDSWIYGRYMDHLFSVVAVVGLSLLSRLFSWRLVGLTTAVATVIGGLFLVLTVPQMVDGGYWIDVHVAGVSHYLSLDTIIAGEPENWLGITAAAIGLTVVIATAASVRRASVLVLALYWTVLSLAVDSTRVDPRDDYYRTNVRIGDLVAPLPADQPVGIDVKYGQSNNLVVFWANPRPVGFVEVGDSYPGVDAVLSPVFSPGPAEAGALVVDQDPYGSFTVWVYPSDLQDALASTGMVIPPPDFGD